MGKADTGNFFDDFQLGQEISHATPRTVSAGDTAFYLATTGSRFLQHCSDPFARSNGLEAAPIEDLLAFHLAFGKTVPDVSLNAVANLGYADGRFVGLGSHPRVEAGRYAARGLRPVGHGAQA